MIGVIRQGDRGPAVEDVQKRLLTLGFELGPTGVDGVFLGATLAAVRSFQRDLGLAEDGTVGDETWAALVDATFTLGDRLLYLRYPYLHGADVRVLQGALNVLGFAAGPPDGIFGAFTERAVREFQANAGLPVDGIAGSETVRTIERLRHVWHDKDPSSPAALSVAPARAAEALRHTAVALVAGSSAGRAVAERVANLAHATEPEARVTLCDAPPAAEGLVLHLTAEPDALARPGVPTVALGDPARAVARFVAAFGVADAGREAVVIVSPDAAHNEHAAQADAVRILDGVCAVLGRG